ncbi:DEAD/DEAH box helicase [Eubacteriales bacterium OttesenSCG-928-A19]|nr:DEAD/DEAH box helicase [Eubacteriales bacterium OttesenSCG-928-A19]
MQLRDYQEDLIDRARQAMRYGSKRILVVAPCGAGKTILSTFMSSEHAAKGGHVIFIAHRRELLEQTENTFKAVGQSMDGIDILSVQTAVRRLDKLKQPTMIVVDEAHHAAAGMWKKLIAEWPDAWVVGLTATPCRLDGRGLGDVFDEMITGITTEELIQRQYLAPYRYFAPTLASTSDLKVTAGDYNKAATAKLMDTPAIIGDAVAHYHRIASGKQAIIYCASVEHSKNVAAAMSASGIRAEHLDGDTRAMERRRIINEFRNRRIMALTNVDLLGEGFDVPACDATIMLRPTQSTALYIQQSMRCMRYQEGKTAIIIDHVGNVARHGFPDDAREWTLTAPKRRRKRERDPRFTTCENCFAVYQPPPFFCPCCGAAQEKQRAELEQLDGVLEEITPEARQRIQQQKREEVKAATSYDDLVRIGRDRGYAPGWAYHRAKARGWVY